MYRHIYGKGVYKVRKLLPACVCLRVRGWWPDDADDAAIQQQIGGVAGGANDPYNVADGVEN